jgi:hypothetical protein
MRRPLHSSTSRGVEPLVQFLDLLVEHPEGDVRVGDVDRIGHLLVGDASDRPPGDTL